MHRRLLEYRPDFDAFGRRAVAIDRQRSWSEDEEMNEAAELLDRLDGGELEGYLVDLIDRAGGAADRPVTTALAAIVGRSARRLLRPTGTTPAVAASRIFGLELEGLSPEDQEFEVARRFVRFASAAARRVGRAAGTGSPISQARLAAASAARTLAPGLLPARTGGRTAAGSWVRRGRRIIVLEP